MILGSTGDSWFDKILDAGKEIAGKYLNRDDRDYGGPTQTATVAAPGLLLLAVGIAAYFLMKKR